MCLVPRSVWKDIIILTLVCCVWDLLENLLQSVIFVKPLGLVKMWVEFMWWRNEILHSDLYIFFIFIVALTYMQNKIYKNYSFGNVSHIQLFILKHATIAFPKFPIQMHKKVCVWLTAHNRILLHNFKIFSFHRQVKVSERRVQYIR
jgi:hypothetical protein